MPLPTTIPHVETSPFAETFLLECSICCKEVEVTCNTQPFREVGRGPMLAYYGPHHADRRSTLAGVSDGYATNFECLSCHAKKWFRDLPR